MTWILIALVALSLLGLLAIVNGADTRDGEGWARHRPI